MLRASNLQSGYGDLTILRGLSFDLAAGQVLAVLGHNGVGKTTLLRTLIGVLRPRDSEIIFDGTNLVGLKPYRVAELGIAYIPQEAALFPDLSVAENLRVAFGRRREFEAACDRALAPFVFLRDRFRQRAGTLSGGEQKMLLVARALLVAPRMIMADEVSEGVQPIHVGRIREVLQEEKLQNGTTMILVEQNLDFALGLADRYLLIKQGAVASSGETAAAAKSEIESQLAL